jgi:CBS domain-containing protein
MLTSQSFSGNRTTEAGNAVDPLAMAMAELAEAREVAHERRGEFSAATLHEWNELESEIENTVESLKTRLLYGSETAVDTALARVNELQSAIHQFVENHLNCPARSLMHTDVRVCSPDDSLDQVAHLLWDADCGALPVVDHSGRLVAVITDRDVCMATYIQGSAPCAVRVASVMSKHVHTCAPDESLARMCEIMSQHQVRRLPVVDAEHHLVGIVSIADVARHLNGLPPEHQARHLLVTTLSAICDPRTPANATTPASG